MKRIAIISLVIVFLTTQYSYTLAACELCAAEVSGILNDITKPDTEALEEMFIELGLSDDLELTDLDNSYRFTLGEIAVTLVPLYGGGIYLLAEKEGDLLGAVKHDGLERTIIPNSIIPEQTLLILICIVMIPALLAFSFDVGFFCVTIFRAPTPDLLRCLFSATLAVIGGFYIVDLCFFE